MIVGTANWFEMKIKAALEHGDFEFALWLEALFNDWKRFCKDEIGKGEFKMPKKSAKKKPAKKKK